jgi:hypothetical protein
MSNDERKAKFQLIRKPKRLPPRAEQFVEPTGQGMLFPLPKRDLLIFLVFPLVTEDEFTKTLELAKPATILELRRSPRFDIGQLNRQEAFRWFEATHAKYYDLSSVLASEQRESIDPVHLVRLFLNRSGSQLAGPIMLLLSDTALREPNDDASLPAKIARLFVSASKHPWQTVEIPQFA